MSTKEIARLTLKPGREKSVLRRHPWVFSGAVASVEGYPAPGETVELHASDGQFLARAAFSPSSQIRARVWTFDPAEFVDLDFFRRRIDAAIRARWTWQSMMSTDSYRMIHAESDGLPGLIVDRYKDMLVMQSLTAGSEYWKDSLATLVLEAVGLTTLFERSDADVRVLEGLVPCVGLLRGTFNPQPIIITENDQKFKVNIETGHKTGFYLDQRLNRQRVRGLAQGRDVLDCFCYTGGFSVNALAGGAKSVLSVDSSADALSLCRENILLNSLPPDRHTGLEGDVFQVLRKLRDEARSFDLVILDPPKFAPTAAQAAQAARGYKDINLLAFKLLRPCGILVTFSCSGGIDSAFFQKIIASAALDAGVEAQILEYLSQAPDHPVALNFPEGAYLKGLVCLKR
jgi:23S rRNA (cytosine1962-C5)-methyltransferase